MVRSTGLEPVTYALEVRCSDPTELRARSIKMGRERIELSLNGLKGRCFTIKLSSLIQNLLVSHLLLLEKLLLDPRHTSSRPFDAWFPST